MGSPAVLRAEEGGTVMISGGHFNKIHQNLHGDRLTPNPHFRDFVLETMNLPMRPRTGTWLTGFKTVRQPDRPWGGGWVNADPVYSSAQTRRESTDRTPTSCPQRSVWRGGDPLPVQREEACVDVGTRVHDSHLSVHRPPLDERVRSG